AAIVALKELPAVNAEIDGDDLIYKNHYDIGVAVGTEQGLVVPVVRDADHKSFADIEKEIGGLGRKARDGKLTIEDLSGGTFTISNGGVYGSLLSTPILNPPQSAILGMHKIERRPIAVAEHGIKIDGASLDLAAMMTRKDKVVTTLTRGVEFLFRKNKVEWIKGTARIAAPGRVAVTANDGGSREIEAGAIIVATGSESIP